MKNDTTAYKAEFDKAVELAQVILDMEGGRMILSMACELIQEMLTAVNCSGAAIVIRKLYELAELPVDGDVFATCESLVWLNIIKGILEDCADAA